MQNFITIFRLFQEVGPFSLSEFGARQSLDKCHFAISRARCCQYQCVCKSLSKYSKWFTSYRHFSRTVRGQNLYKRFGEKNLHKLSGDKIKRRIIGHTLKVNLQFRLTFLGWCNFKPSFGICLYMAFVRWQMVPAPPGR